MAKQTYTKDERKAQFLKAGLELAKKEPLDKISVAAVAAKCKVTAPLVFHVFGNRDKFQAAIKREAKKQGVKLAEPKAAVVKKAPTRKRSIAEVKAIKDKAAGTRPPKGAQRPAKAGSRARTAKPDSPKPAVTSGKKARTASAAGTVIAKNAAAKKPAGTGKKARRNTTPEQRAAMRQARSGVNSATKRKQSSQKYPTNPVPQVTLPDEPKASL